MRTELKIGVAVVVVICVMVIVYVLFLGPGDKPKPGDGLSLRDSNHSLVRGSPSGQPARSPSPSASSITIGRLPSASPSASPSPSATPLASADSELRPGRTVGGESPSPSASGTTLLPPVSYLSSSSPSASPSARPASASLSPFVPTPAYTSFSPSPTAAPVDDRATLSSVRGPVEANASGTAARAGLVRKADGKDYYTVQKGDMGYWDIAKKPFIYGDGRKWDAIAKANPNIDPGRLQAGQELVIPPMARAAGSTTRPVAGAPGTGIPLAAGSSTTAGEKYAVKAGDTLETIARARYGDGAKWPVIAKANPGLEPSRLRIGQEIVIPPATEASSAGTATTAPAGSGATPRPALAHTAPSPVATPASSVRPRPAATPSGWD